MNELMTSTDPGIKISSPAPLLHGDSWVESPVVVQAVLAPHNLIQIGAFTGIYGGRLGHCRIGRYCSIAPGVDIASDQHPTGWLSSSMVQYVNNIHGWGSWLEDSGLGYVPPVEFFDSNSPVTIGNDVWLGQGVFVKSGVRIGDGAIAAAHSVITRDVPPYAIVAGVPAKVVRMRFDTSLIDRLLETCWWKYNVLAMPNIKFSEPLAALKALEGHIHAGTAVEVNPLRFKLSA